MIIPFLIGLCWGSFLNVLAHRLLTGEQIFTQRSLCPNCTQVIAWYDLIPVFSWFILRGRCRWCAAPISFLYPVIELVTAIWVTELYRYNYSFGHAPFIASFLTHLIFFSALTISTRTDIEAMVVFRLMTLWLIPFAVLCSALGFTTVSWQESSIGAILGYGFLFIIGSLFMHLRGKQGIGVGDYELLALIGAFLGPFGAWTSLMYGSIIGSITGSIYLICTKQSRLTRIPFGPFLALGAVIFLIRHTN